MPEKPAEASAGRDPRSYGGAAIFTLALLMAISFIASGNRFIPDKWLNQDGAFYYMTLRTLVDHRSLAQDATQPRSWYERDLGWNRNLGPDWSDVAVGRGGHWYPKHPILMPLATVPFFLAFGAYGALILNLLCLALIPLLGYRLALRVAPWPAALAAAALMASTAYLSGQAWGYSNDLFYSVLALGAFEAAFAGSAGLAGLLFGLCVFAKATNAIYAPAFLLLYLLRREAPALVRFGLFALPPMVIFAGLNTWMYGAPWHTGYNHILIRQNGLQAFHDHALDFDWAHYGQHLHHALLEHGSFGLYDRAFWWLLAIPGAIVAVFRVPRVALPLLLAASAPLLLNAPFQWFRVEFLDAPVAMSLCFIAALLVPWARAPAEPHSLPGRIRWERLAPVGVLGALLVCAAVRAAIPTGEDYLARHLTSAHAFLGPIPCDYFNWQVQRWECANFDQGRDELMTGRSLAEPPRFAGRPVALLQISPHPTRQPRRLEYSAVPMGKRFEIRYGWREGAPARVAKPSRST